MNTRDKTKAKSKATLSKTSKLQSNRPQPSTSTNKSSEATSVNKVDIAGCTKTTSLHATTGPKNKLKAFKDLKKSNSKDKKSEDKDSNEMFTSILPNKEKERAMADNLEQETDVDGGKHIDSDNEEDESTGLLTISSGSDSSSRTINSKNCKEYHAADKPSLPRGWEQHSDKVGLYYWHVSSGIIQRNRPTEELSPRKDCVVVYHDDEEINQIQKTSSDDDDYCESGAALTAADDNINDASFVVYSLGCCEFDETHLVSATSTKAIQKCILTLSNKPPAEETSFWGLDQTQPVLMGLFEDRIQFTDINSRTLLRSLGIHTIKTWAVDDDNNFAFVIEDKPQLQQSASTNYFIESVDYALESEPVLMCYVFRSFDDDNMSCKVATKLNEQFNRFKEQMSDRISKSTRLQQMVEPQPFDDQTDTEDFDELVASNELTMNVKYIGSTPVPRHTGLDILNIAIDKCLAEASNVQISRRSMADDLNKISPLIESKLHVSPSSVIVENVLTGEIIVECRIRYLTFMGISKRDIRWCGFIMQNAINKTFVAHCFECHPTAGNVCEAIQASCLKMYQKVVKNSKRQPETMSIIPTSSKIRNTLAKTFSRIKLNSTT